MVGILFFTDVEGVSHCLLNYCMNMKSKLYLVLPAFFLLILAIIPITFAEDYTRWHLPEGAKARLGKGLIGQVRYSPDGTQLAVASTIGIQIYDTQTGEALDLFTEHTKAFGSVAFSPDGTILASTDTSGSICLWDIGTYQLLRTLEGHTSEVNGLSFSPDGKMLASGGIDGTSGKDGFIHLWDVQTGRQLRRFDGHINGVRDVSFHPDGKVLVSGDADGTIRFWNVLKHTNHHSASLKTYRRYRRCRRCL